MTDYYKQHEAEWMLQPDPRPTNWLDYGADLQPDKASWLDYLPFGKTHRLYHGLMMAIALMVLWKVRKL